MLPQPSQFLHDETQQGPFRRFMRRVDGAPGHFTVELDNSSLAMFRSCPRSYEYYAMYGRDSASRDALNYGSAMHQALEAYFRDDLDEPALLDVLQKAFHENPTDSDSWRTYEHAAESIRRYLAYHAQMLPWTIEFHGGQRCVELPFRYHLFDYVPEKFVLDWPVQLVADNVAEETSVVDAVAARTMATYVKHIAVFYTGKIDLIVQQNGHTVVVDHKTTSIEGATFWSQFVLSSQLLGYCWAATQMLQRPVSVAMIDALIGRKPTQRGSGVPHEYARRTFHYSDEQIAEWHNNTIVTVTRLLDNFVASFFPQNTDACYGKFPCAYREVCPLPRHMRASALRSGAFTARTWSPLTSTIA